MTQSGHGGGTQPDGTILDPKNVIFSHVPDVALGVDEAMRRREFITLGSSVVAWPFAARAQQSGLPVIGYLDSRASGDAPQLLAAFRQGIKEAGFIEGQNVAIEYRFSENQPRSVRRHSRHLLGLG
jgi:hypothetical protein